MTFLHPILASIALTLGLPLAAWHPSFHEAQTRLALRMIPKGMAEFIQPHQVAMLRASRGVGNAKPPTLDEVENQFIRVVQLTEERRRPVELAREMGILAQMVQLLLDPSATQGASPMRDTFERFGQEKLHRMVVTREPFWGATGPLDPRPSLAAMMAERDERAHLLRQHLDPGTGQRQGAWDDLSVPFALLQGSFSGGVNATANLYTQLWRACGSRWTQGASHEIAGGD